MFPVFFKFRFAAAVLAAVLLSGGGAIAAEGDDCNLDGTAVEMGGTGDGREIVDEYCVLPTAADALDKCRQAGWGFIAAAVLFDIFFVSCQIPIRNFTDYQSSDGVSGDAGSCGIYLSNGKDPESPCKSVFGAGFDFPENDESGDQRFVYNCPEFTDPDADYVSGGVQSCIARDEKGVCAGLFGGTPEMSGMEEVCSGIDANDTFCFVGAPEAFPCEGLFRHVSLCNFDYNRPALNPFFCGARCGENQVAKGAGCSCAAGFEESAGGGACVPESQ